RADRGGMLADIVAGIDETDTDGENHGSDDPEPDLHQHAPPLLERRPKPVVDAEQEKRHPAQQIKMRMCGKRRMVLRDRHLDAPDHARDDEENRCLETERGRLHVFLPAWMSLVSTLRRRACHDAGSTATAP